MSGFRNEADVSMPLSGALQVFHNCEKASVLPSGPRVWLEADFVEFSDRFQVLSKLLNHEAITGSLIGGNKRVKVQFGPSQRDHFACSIKLKSTAPQ